MCYPFVFEFSVRIGGFVIGLGQISFFFSLPRFTSVEFGGMVNFSFPSSTSEMISISTSQTFHSYVVIFHLRRPMACLSLNLYDTPGLAPRMNVLF